MFTSPCSLRSSQCAALIAFAAAAGIVRVPVATAASATERPVAHERRVTVTIQHPAPAFVFSPGIAFTVEGVLRPDTQIAPPESEYKTPSATLVGSEDVHLILPLSVEIQRAHFDLVRFADRTAHRLPFAIGPPFRAAQRTDAAVPFQFFPFITS